MFISDLIIKDKAPMAMDDLFLEPDTRRQFDQLIKEHGYSQELVSYGLPLSNKVLLHGSSGCGKTATAKAIAAALGKEIERPGVSRKQPHRPRILPVPLQQR